MARTVEQIYNQIVTIYWEQAVNEGVVVVPPAEWGLLNRKRLWANAQAFAIFLLESMFDTYKREVNLIIFNTKPGTPQWYVEKAKAFQFGFELAPGKDYYDNTGISDADVAASKVVAYAAFTENPYTRLKVAKLVNGRLGKLSDEQLAAFVQYMIKIKYAGVKLRDNQKSITSSLPDKLLLNVTIKYDPLVLNALGMNRDGSYPVPAAIRAYLSQQSLYDFNGLFDVQRLEAAMLAVEGVKSLAINNIMTKYALLPFTSVYINFVPDGGYTVIDDGDLTINYIAQ